MISKKLQIILLYIFFIPVYVMAQQNIYFVNQKHAQADDSNSGSEDLPWLTIQHAANVAQPGDMISVFPGSYGRVKINNSGTLDKIITFKGTKILDITFPDNSNAQLNNSNEVAATQGFDLNADYIRIENFEITNIGSSSKGAFNFSNVNSVAIVNNYIHELNCANRNWGAVRGNGVNIIIKGNIMWRVEGITIMMSGENWLIENNDISHGTDLTPEGVDVCGDADAIRIFGSNHIIRNNFIHDYIRSEGSSVEPPHMDCFQTYSVNGEYAHNIVIEKNHCYNIGAQFVMFEDHNSQNNVHHFTFRNNIFSNAHGATAVNIKGLESLVFVNNLIAYSGRGLRLREGSHHATVLNNIFFENSNAILFTEDSESEQGSVWDYNLYYPNISKPSGYEFDEHSLFGINPIFTDAEGENFYLKPTSQAKDNGTDVSYLGITNDKDGTSRPEYSGWDIGPYEYNLKAPVDFRFKK